jgi:hypothetical protein
MKLQKLLRTFENLLIRKFIFSSFLILFVLFAFSCEDKIPSKSIDETILNFTEKSVSGELLSVEKQDAKYFATKDLNLFVGENEEFKSYALLKFSDMASLSDTLDVLDVKLTLYTNYTLPFDTTITDDNWINVYLLMGNPGMPWSESDWDYSMKNPMDVASWDKKLITTYHIGESDTFEVDLPDSLVAYWSDSLNVEAGLLLEGTSENGNRIQKFYSSNSSTKNPMISAQYIASDDSVTKYYEPSDDVTVFENKQIGEPRNNLTISEMYNEALFVKFDMADMINDPDSNVYVPEARLKLYVDLENSQLYDDYLMLNYSLIDTNEYYPEYIYDNQTADDYILLGYKDSVVTFDFHSPVQQYTTFGLENNGILIWMRYSSNDISNIQFFDENADPSLRPELKVLFAKEER